MAGSVNKVILIGRVGKDPTTKQFQNGNKVVNFSVATDKSWRDKASGERKQEVTWHNIAIFDTRVADIAEKYVRKGSHIVIEGEIRNRTYEKDGETRYVSEVAIPAFGGSLTLLGGGERREQSESAAKPAARGGPTGGAGYDETLSDEIPFGPSWM